METKCIKLTCSLKNINDKKRSDGIFTDNRGIIHSTALIQSLDWGKLSCDSYKMWIYFSL